MLNKKKLHVKKQKLEFNKDKHPDNCKKSQRLAASNVVLQKK